MNDGGEGEGKWEKNVTYLPPTPACWLGCMRVNVWMCECFFVCFWMLFVFPPYFFLFALLVIVWVWVERGKEGRGMMVPPPLSSPPFLSPCTRPHSLIRPCFHCHSSPPCPLFPLLILTPSTRNQPVFLHPSLPSLPSHYPILTCPYAHTPMSPCPTPHAPWTPQSSPLLTFSEEEGEGAGAALSTGAVPLAVPEVDCVRIFYWICWFFYCWQWFWCVLDWLLRWLMDGRIIGLHIGVYEYIIRANDSICTCLYTHTYIHISKYNTWVCIFIHMYMYVYVYMYSMHMYMYMYIPTW